MLNDSSSTLYNFIPYLAIVMGGLAIFFMILWIKSMSKASKVDGICELLDRTEREKQEALQELDFLRNAKHQVEINEKMARQELESMRVQMQDWEKTKEKHLEAAKSSMLEASNNLSNKLLEDHKRESDIAKKDVEERVKKTTEELQQKFQNVFENMKSLSDQVNNFGSSVDLIQNSLLNPQGAGALAEIALENILKNSGLEKNRDYFMQYSVESADTGKRLRPDVVIFLPGENVLVVDSKSSKFFLESGNISDEEYGDKNIELKNSMNKHLSDLINKDYKKSVSETLNDFSNNPNKEYKNIHMVMFLPTDIAAEKTRLADSKFFDVAYSNNIIPVGPSGLVNILMQAKMLIEKSKQEENYHHIMDLVEKMIHSVANLHGYAEGLGKSLNSSMDKYNKFVGSFNVAFLSKVKKIKALGGGAGKSGEVLPLTKYETLRSSYEEIDKEES